jgi:tuberculosinol/isotuberculosinol synthase
MSSVLADRLHDGPGGGGDRITMDAQAFQGLSTAEVAQLARTDGPKVCVFPINGTRRWFLLEYPEQAAEDFVDAYLRIGGQRHIELYKMFFDHGLDTLLTPIFGPDLLERGDAYMQIAAKGLLWFIQDQEFLDFYDAYDVRVRIYGDAHRYFDNTPYAYLLEAFDEISQRTASHHRYRLFFGVCAHDATETVAEISVRFYQEHGRLPDKRQIVEAYYGEYVEPVDLFIGFDRLTVFDMPLIATGDENLYFTVSPSPYLDAHALRAILYDLLYARHADESSYADLSAEDWQTLRDFYVLNRQSVLGLGRRHPSGNFWYPLPQVSLPSRMAEAKT